MYKSREISMTKRLAVLISISVLMMIILPCDMLVQASQPKVMVVDCEVVQDQIVAGQTFDLKVKIRNTGSRYVDNLKISVTSEAGDIVPAEGAGNGFLEELEDGGEHIFTFKLKASEGLAEKSYKLSVVNDYDDIWGNPYTATDVIYLPVKLAQRASISDMFVEEEVVLGDSVEIIGSVNNMGAGTLYNVRAKVVSDFFGETDTFIGNIETGKSGSIDILTNAVASTGESGEPSKIQVIYEDKEGRETTIEKVFLVKVDSPVYDNVEKVKDNTGSSHKMIMYVVGAVVVAVILCIIRLVRKSRKKRAICDEF